MNKFRSLALALCLLPCMVTAQTDKWRAAPNATAWQCSQTISPRSSNNITKTLTPTVAL